MSANRAVPIDVSSRHGHVSSRMEEYATKKAERLLRFHDGISRIEIVVDGPHESPDVEMIVHVDNVENLASHESADHFSAAMDALATKMERRLIKLNERRKDHKGPSIRGMPVPEGESEPKDSFEDAMRRDLDR